MNINYFQKLIARGIALVAFACLSESIAFSQSTSLDYVIDGKIDGMTSGKIYTVKLGQYAAVDSTMVKDGKFNFKGMLQEPSMMLIVLDLNYNNKPKYMMFTDQGKHQVLLKKEDLENGIVEGSKTAMDYVRYAAITKPYEERFKALFAAAERAEISKEEADTQWSKIYTEMIVDIEAFIRTNPASVVSIWATQRNFTGNSSDAAKLESLNSLFSTKWAYTSYAKYIQETLKTNQTLAIGKFAPDFTQNDQNGQPVSLSDFRGKYVLIDFWASWCGPCRADNPNLVKAYQAFHDKGFTVLGVSLDGDKENWIKAIATDGLTWTHLSDLKFWKNAVAQQYGVKAVPSNLLIDPTGQIIAKNLHGGQLEETLKKVLK